MERARRSLPINRACHLQPIEAHSRMSGHTNSPSTDVSVRSRFSLLGTRVCSSREWTAQLSERSRERRLSILDDTQHPRRLLVDCPGSAAVGLVAGCCQQRLVGQEDVEAPGSRRRRFTDARCAGTACPNLHQESFVREQRKKWDSRNPQRATSPRSAAGCKRRDRQPATRPLKAADLSDQLLLLRVHWAPTTLPRTRPSAW